MKLKKTENKKTPADVDKLSLTEISAECFDQRPEPRLHVISLVRGLVSAMAWFSSCLRVLNRGSTASSLGKRKKKKKGESRFASRLDKSLI
jgi:hypothetical protein